MGSPNRNDVAVDIKAMLAVAQRQPPFITKHCIYRVPHQIRELNPAAYTPKVVSIGPFHHYNNIQASVTLGSPFHHYNNNQASVPIDGPFHRYNNSQVPVPVGGSFPHYGNKILESMESHKQIYCQKFIERIRSETILDNLIISVQNMEPDVRGYYSEEITLSVEELVKVILVDCCFIFEFFLRNYFNEWTPDDAITLKPWLTSHIKLDLVLLENQLPFYVFQNLYNIAFASRQNDGIPTYPSFMKLIFHYFADYNKQNLLPSATTSIEHFTDLLRTFHLQPSNQRPKRGNTTISQLNSASELNEAGVKFKVNQHSHCLLDLKILRGRRLCYLVQGPRCLKIPEFKVEDWTEILFRNMVALEQCHYPNESYITDYVAVLSFLIKTGKDVDHLVHEKIIVSWLGDSNAVAKLFNGLWKNITQVGFNCDYVGICRELDAFCVHPWYSRKATLRRDYCKTPWQKFASFAAILVIILTIIQTVCSILQVV